MTSAMDASGSGQILAFAHIGDLHLTDAKQRNFTDFAAIVAQIATECAEALDFVVLPGDTADNGLPAQYKLVSTVLKMLSVPVYAIPGDHDMEQGSLEGFRNAFVQPGLPLALTIRGTRCLFLDVCGPGNGGPDFRLGHAQLQWTRRELDDASARGEPVVVFMHSYPDDLKGDGETAELNQLFRAHDVALVDMGHTHYNELANDGHTIFAATRSTGQIEEGPVGYSIATLDNGVVSWRFKPLDDPFPFVVITSPSDRRLLRSADHIVAGSCEVRALVLGSRPLKSVACKVTGGDWREMHRQQDPRIWAADVALPTGPVAMTVRAIDETGRPGQHQIEAATQGGDLALREALGSDAATIGAWPENGIFGTQLGPNRNAKPAA